MMAFDECPPGDAEYDYAKKSWELTSRWLGRCFEQYAKTEPKYGHYQSLFPIVQGCTYPDLRARSAEFVQQFGADGYAIGGLAVGEPAPVMYEMIERPATAATGCCSPARGLSIYATRNGAMTSLRSTRWGIVSPIPPIRKLICAT